MARYIDADNFRKTMIKRFGCIPCLTDYSEASRYDIPIDDALNLAPTADVVPRREIERLQADAVNLKSANADLALALLYECEPTKEHLSELERAVREKVAREIFDDIAELKKKYIPTGVQESRAEDKEFFTPEEVRKMSNAEVRQNYAKIINSMAKWHEEHG